MTPKIGDTFDAIAHVAGRSHPAGPFVCGKLNREWVRSIEDGEGDYWTFKVAEYRFEILKKGVSP